MDFPVLYMNEYQYEVGTVMTAIEDKRFLQKNLTKMLFCSQLAQ